MTRIVLWAGGGVLLGLLIHLVVILILPSYASETVWTRVAAMDTMNDMTTMAAPAPGEDNPFGLDPALVYGVCQIDLSEGPAYVRGPLPEDFWSLSVYDTKGRAVYSTTNRAVKGRNLDMGIFNPSQTRMLAEQTLEVRQGLLIVEAFENDAFVAIRLAPDHVEMAPRYAEALNALQCGPVQQ